ncbi:FadR/GntR family transcriptional regulator [Niabella soli]|nr:FCD domain-containing protein [Niabella soli]
MSDIFIISFFYICAMPLHKLRPVENLTQVDKIEMSLQEFLKAENYQPGDPLPKEIELAKAMGVSRTAIREALSRFRTLGIIESRKNRGMILAKPDLFVNMERVLDPQLLDDETLNELFEMRLVIEVGLGDLLFRSRQQADFKQLEAIIEKEKKAKSSIERLKCDMEFHSALYRLSGNDTIARFQKILLPIFEHVYLKLKDASMPYPSNLADEKKPVTHQDLLKTLKRGTLEQFRRQMRQHLLVYFKKLNS